MSPAKSMLGSRSRSFACSVSILCGLFLQAVSVRAVRSQDKDLIGSDAEELAHRRRSPTTRRRSPPIVSDDHLERNYEGTVVHDIGIFSGLILRSDFDRASFWGRDCQQHQVHHGIDDEDFQVFASSYNECTGVSDIVYYSVHGDKFTPGAGRGGDWTNDPKLKQIMIKNGKKPSEYATTSDYDGVGFFSIDRGHQAPVGSFNVDEEAASMTNTPTNLSPQSGILNRNNWKYLEMDMRLKAGAVAGEGEQDLDMLTGPIYELPPAMLQNAKGKLLWQQLLETGGDANEKEPWCKEKDGSAFRSSVLLNKKGEERTEMTECLVDGNKKMKKASDDPNRLKISYKRSTKHLPLRAPLGYFKLMVMKSGSKHGRRTCAYIMDQVGQCLLVSVELLIKLAHLDAKETNWALAGGLEVKNGSTADSEYNAYVSPYWCIPSGSTLRKKDACLFKTNKVQDPAEITTELMDEYWSRKK